MRFRTALCAALVLPLLPAALLPRASAHDEGCVARGAWSLTAPPRFASPASPQVIAAYTTVGDRLLVTDGLEVLSSTGGGCRWRSVFALPDTPTAALPLSARTARVRALRAAVGRDGTTRIYLLVADAGNPAAARLALVASFDNGTTWQLAGQGLPPLAVDPAGSGRDNSTPRCSYPQPCDLQVAPSDPDRLYLATATASQGPGAVSVSADAGRTWTTAATPVSQTDVTQQAVIAQLAVDPLDANDVWFTLGHDLFHTTDGARTWTSVPAGEDRAARQSVVGLTVTHAPRRPAEVTAFVADGATDVPPRRLARSVDGGMHFTTTPVTGYAGLVGQVARGTDVLVATSGTDPGSATEAPNRAYAAAPGTGRFAALPGQPAIPLHDPAYVAGPCPAYLFLSTHELARYSVGGCGPTPPPATGDDERFTGTFAVPALVPPPPATLTPASSLVRLTPGVTAGRDYRLGLPPHPSPLDLALLFDNSGSMGPPLEGLRASAGTVAATLAAAHVDTRYAFATFSDLADRYQRRADLRLPDAVFQRALDVGTGGGNQEPDLTALDQLVTGRGLDAHGTGGDVPPGRNVHFRPYARHAVVLATDEPFGTDPLGPTLPQVVATLRNAGVLVVGLHVHSGYTGTVSVENNPADDTAAAAQLGQLVAGSGAYAPAGGVDCDGDGRTDVAPGAPLVCPVARRGDAGGVGPALVALARAVADTGAVRLDVAAPAGFTATSRAAVAGPLDLTVAHTVDLPVDLGCTARAAGTNGTVTLTAIVRDRPVASARVLVACGSASRVPGDTTEHRRGLDVGAALVPPHAAAVGPAADAVSVPGGTPELASSTSTGYAATPGLAAEPDEQFELALASDHRRGDDVPAGAILGVGMALAAGLALSRRSARGAPAIGGAPGVRLRAGATRSRWS